MVFGLFRKKDPVCGMKEEKGKGLHAHDNWFCNKQCLEQYEQRAEKQSEKGGSCCH